MIDPSELLRPEPSFAEKELSKFRDYTVDEDDPLKQRVQNTYRLMHKNQTVDFVKGQLMFEVSIIVYCACVIAISFVTCLKHKFISSFMSWRFHLSIWRKRLFLLRKGTKVIVPSESSFFAFAHQDKTLHWWLRLSLQSLHMTCYGPRTKNKTDGHDENHVLWNW